MRMNKQIMNKVKEILEVCKIRTNEIPLINRIDEKYIYLDRGLKGSDNKRKLLRPIQLTEFELGQIRQLNDRTIRRCIKRLTGKTPRQFNYLICSELFKKNNGSISLTARDTGHLDKKNLIYYLKNNPKVVIDFLRKNPPDFNTVILIHILDEIKGVKTQFKRVGL